MNCSKVPLWSQMSNPIPIQHHPYQGSLAPVALDPRSAAAVQASSSSVSGQSTVAPPAPPPLGVLDMSSVAAIIPTLTSPTSEPAPTPLPEIHCCSVHISRFGRRRRRLQRRSLELGPRAAAGHQSSAWEGVYTGGGRRRRPELSAAAKKIYREGRERGSGEMQLSL